MFEAVYNNFIRSTSTSEQGQCTIKAKPTKLNGEEAKRLYLEEISQETEKIITPINKEKRFKNYSKLKTNIKTLSDKDVFIAAQTDDVETVRIFLKYSPEKINMIDYYGWSLLMIACQANSVDIVKELLKCNADTSIRDKAGNSAYSLVIKNRNLVLADLFLSYKQCKTEDSIKLKSNKIPELKPFICDICNKQFPDKIEHLSSTVHNINASKGKKIPTCYKIPESNKGYQIMLKAGWDRDLGLGPDGTGKMYPIKTVQKKDRKGLGHKKPKLQDTIESNKNNHKTKNIRQHYKSKKLEINFRREFY